MSNAAIHWAWKQATGGPAQKLVLVTLADLADEYHSCWPSHEYIAGRTEMSDRSIRRHIQALEDIGLVLRRRRYTGFGKRQNDRFYLYVDGEFLDPGALEAKLATNNETPDQALAANLASNAATATSLEANCGRYIETPHKGWLVGNTSATNQPTNQSSGYEKIDAEIQALHPGLSLSMQSIEIELAGRVPLEEIDVVRAIRETVIAAAAKGQQINNPASYVASVIVRHPSKWVFGQAEPQAFSSTFSIPEIQTPSQKSECNIGNHWWGSESWGESARSHCVECGESRRNVDPQYRAFEDASAEVSS